MEVITVSQALKRQEGELIIAMKGTLTDVNKPITGAGADGPYTFQNCRLQCTENPKNKIKLKIWNHDDVTNLRGQVIYLLSTKGEGKKSNEWFGVKRVLDTYQGANGPMIECTRKADVTTSDPEGGSTPPAQTTRQQAPAPRQQAAAPNQTQGTQGNRQAPKANQGPKDPQTLEEREEGYRNAISTARVKMGKCANLYLVCMKAALHIANQWKADTGLDMSQDQFEKCTASLFIEANKQFLSGGLPPGDMAKYLSTPKEESGK